METQTKLPSGLKISTMTATAQLAIPHELVMKDVFDKLETNKNIVYINYGKEHVKGFNPKNESKKKKQSKKVFFNQITVIVNVENDFNNIKLFNNGSISMTGVKSDINAKRAIEILVENMRLPGVKLNMFDIVWKNSDFDCGFEIKRNILHQLLVNSYQIFSSFEPCIYPGVMSKFFWNSSYKNETNCMLGKCYCSSMCSGKGTGTGEGNCKKITISVFQSGSVIIGGKTNEQLVDAYNFISNIFSKHKEELKKVDANFVEREILKGSKKKEKVIFIKKENIIY